MRDFSDFRPFLLQNSQCKSLYLHIDLKASDFVYDMHSLKMHIDLHTLYFVYDTHPL
jgi:hypothetical protein